jgi:uncharacterized repeat protein (TIGR02543 family)
MKKRIVFAFLLALLALFIFVALIHCARAQPFSITIDSNPAEGSGFVNVDLIDYATPQTFTWNPGDTHVLEAYSPVPGPAGTQYVFTSWSAPSFGSVPDQSFTYTVPNNDETVTANYQTQYYLTVNNGGEGTAGGQGWYDANTNAQATITPLTVAGTTGTQYVFAGWSGDATGSGSPSNNILMTGPMTATATWTTQYQVTFSQTGLDSDAGSTTVLTLGGTDYAWNPLPSSVWVNSGTPFAWASTVPGVSGEQFIGPGQHGTITAPGLFSTTYTIQYLITFNQVSVGSGFTGTVVTVEGSNYGVNLLPYQIWWNASTNLSFSFASPLIAGSTQYVWSSTSGLSNLQNGALTVTASGSVVGNYQVQYQVTFGMTGVGSDFTGLVVTIDSTDYSASQLPVTFTWSSGSIHSFDFQSPLVVGSTNTKQYVWTSTTGSLTSVQSSYSFTVSTYGSVIGNYKTQYYLTVSSPYDSPSPRSGWFDSGSSITESVTSPASGGQYICTGWTGTGSVPSSGSTTSASFTITAASSITWKWQSSAGELSLTVYSSHGNPNPSVGESYWTNGSSVTCSVDSPVTEDYYVWTCTGWAGTGSVSPSGTNNAVTFTITQDSTINWTWTGTPVKYNLTVSSAYGNPNPGVGVQSYDGGQNVTCNVSSPVTANGTVWTCTGWTGTGSVPATGIGTSVTFNITQDSSITWNWQILQYTLTVSSAQGGNPSPPIGSNLFNSGTNITCSVSINVTEGNTTWICKGWSGTGSVPPSGTGNSVNVILLANSTITWLWHNSTAPQYDLMVSSQYGNPIPSGDNLYDEGENISCSVDTSVNINGTTYVCTGWNGTGSVPPNGTGNSFNFIISQNSTITWNWQLAQWTLTVSSTYGNPIPSGENVYNDGANVTCSVTSPWNETGISYTCTGWTGTGSVPSSGTGTSTTFIINLNSTITWIWVVTSSQWNLAVSSAHGSPSPSVGDHLYNDGDSVTCNVTSPVNESGTVWTCTGWSGSGSVPSTGTTTSVTFVITENSTITWNWVEVSVQWTLTVVSAHGNPSPSVGDHSYNDGTTLSCNVSSPVVENGVSYVCTGWTGTGSVLSSGSGTSTSFTLTEDSTITWTWQVQPTIESCDNTGNKKDVFSPGETVYITGTGYAENQTYSIYIVNATTWINGMAIPEGIQGTATSVSTDSTGIIQITMVCNETLTPGNYDILINVNGTSTYDAQADTLYTIQILPQAQSSPEYVFGTILGLTGCFAALGAFRIYKRKRP